MPQILIEQAMLEDAEDDHILRGRSPGFQEAWLPEARRLCAGFGTRPTGTRCPAAVFAQPLDRRTVAIVQVADRGAELPGLRFRVLTVPRWVYEDMIADPFLVDERFPPDWKQEGALPVLVWPAVPTPQRTVADIQRTLQRSEGPALLGSVQALVDGGRVVFERPTPDGPLLRDLWNLLPFGSRGELWPASFAFSNALRFHAVVVPRAEEGFGGYVNEAQAENYPEGGYELRLQTAAEAGDQAELDALFGRRSASQVWRFGLILVVIAALLAATALFILPPAARRPGVKPVPAGPEVVKPAPKP